MKWRWALLLVLVCSVGGTLFRDAHAKPSDDAVALGRALYQGQIPFSGEVRARGVSLPASAGACVNCHGASGQGSREGGVDVPGITWTRLSQPQRGLPEYHSLGEVRDAIKQGKGRRGEQLNPPMPTVALSAAEAEALVAYLDVIGTEREPVQGVSDDRILVGSLLPLTPRGSYAERIRDGLQERIAAINQTGGIFGRHIELIIEDSGPRGADAVAALERLAHGHRVFALVGPVLPELSAPILEVIERARIPMVATLGVPLLDSPVSNLSYLLPSVTSQVAQLVKEVQSHCRADRNIVILYEAKTLLQDAVRAALADESSIVSVPVERGDDHVPGSHRIVLGSTDFVAPIRKRVTDESADSSSCLATLAVLSGMPRSEDPRQFSHGGTAGVTEVTGLPLPATAMQRDQRFQGDALWAYLADVSAKIFVEALSRSGRILTPDNFERSLYSMHDFEPVAGLPVRFNPQHRHGLSVAHLWWRTQYAYQQEDSRP